MKDISQESEARKQALAREAARIAAERRSAAVTLIDRALIVTGWSEEAEAGGTWDEAAAVAAAREVLEGAGLRAYIPGERPVRISNDLIVNYERPGR